MSGPASVIVVGMRVTGEVEKSNVPQQILTNVPSLKVEVEVLVVPSVLVKEEVELSVSSTMRGLPGPTTPVSLTLALN